ncbi:MAG: hypothetical protein JHC95_04085 [Solirubrobacteraceae bacterium]|nr:hypothetical protein [Solirubrobacteraceae bacterium]
MIPRRLLTVMVLLLVGLVIASALSPPPEDGDDQTKTTPTTTAATSTTPAAKAPEGGASASARLDTVKGTLPRDRTVAAQPGQTVDLTVRTEAATTVEIPALADVQPSSPSDPARFLVVFDAPGRYAVIDAEAEKDLGAVVVRE